MLTDRLGNFEMAIDYVEDCALSDIIGDCKLIEKSIPTKKMKRVSYLIEDKPKLHIAVNIINLSLNIKNYLGVNWPIICKIVI